MDTDQTVKPRGWLFTFEGIECSGKGVQINLLLQYLKTHNLSVISKREPGGTPYGEALRAILKNPETALPGVFRALQEHEDYRQLLELEWTADNIGRTPECEMLMFLASRSEFTDKVLQPNLADGISVIADRLHDSTRAYQGGGRFLAAKKMIDFINLANWVALRGLQPDLTFFLDISTQTMLVRMAKTSADKSAFFERFCDVSFYERVRNEYLQIAKEEPQRFIVIDGEKPIEQVFATIKPYVDRLLEIEA